MHVCRVVLVHGLFDEAGDGALKLIHCLGLAQQTLEVLMRSGLRAAAAAAAFLAASYTHILHAASPHEQ